MCGRISQYREAERYFDLLRADPAKAFQLEHSPVYNVAPGTTPLVIRPGGDGPEMSRAHWGYRGRAPRMYVNGQIEKAASGFWKSLWVRGRILVPADGWFEWTGPKKDRQPHFIYRADGELLLLAAISAPEGFVIVTSEAKDGLLDIHDRRPVALSTAGARRWIDPTTTYEDAVLTAAEEALGANVFTWHDVARAMGNSDFQDASAIKRIEAADVSRVTTAGG